MSFRKFALLLAAWIVASDTLVLLVAAAFHVRYPFMIVALWNALMIVVCNTYGILTLLERRGGAK